MVMVAFALTEPTFSGCQNGTVDPIVDLNHDDKIGSNDFFPFISVKQLIGNQELDTTIRNHQKREELAGDYPMDKSSMQLLLKMPGGVASNSSTSLLFEDMSSIFCQYRGFEFNPACLWRNNVSVNLLWSNAFPHLSLQPSSCLVHTELERQLQRTPYPILACRTIRVCFESCM